MASFTATQMRTSEQSESVRTQGLTNLKILSQFAQLRSPRRIGRGAAELILHILLRELVSRRSTSHDLLQGGQEEVETVEYLSVGLVGDLVDFERFA